MKNLFEKALCTLLGIVLCLTTIPFLSLLTIEVSAKKITAYKKGDIIEFGWYPQSEVTDASLISALNSAGGSWISYNYYSGTGIWSDGKMTSSDYMRYKDVVYGANKYRGVVFDSYRPRFTGSPLSISDTHQDDNGYYTGTTYWFKYEPIAWRVINPAKGIVMSEMILDSQAYQNTIYFNGDEDYQDTTCTTYANDYAMSSIREWLNNDFYDMAFSSSEKAQIITSTCDNSCWNTSYPQYNSKTTYDKIILLSYDDLEIIDYSLVEKYATQGTDYSKCQGLSVYKSLDNSYSELRANGNSTWWLRSPGENSYGACGVSASGLYIHSTCCGVYHTELGVRPALKLDLMADFHHSSTIEHTYETIITLPACTKGGYTTYICDCGDTYTADETKALGHDMSDFTETLAPTCTEMGEEKSECSRCDYFEIRDIVAIGHDYETVVTKPTCTEKGYTTYTCHCNDTYIDDYVGALGHSYTSEITTPATHLTDGVETFTCSCGDTYTEAVAKTTKHTYEATVTAPTCTEKGYTTYTCHCNDTYIADEVDALGHDMSDFTETLAPTCTEIGEERSACSRCDYFETRDIIAIGHDYETVVTEPTCTEKGYTTYTCHCSDTYVADETKALGHEYRVALEAPSCTKQGMKITYCINCTESTTETISALDHTDKDENDYCDVCKKDLDPVAHCSCNCHKGGIMSIIWKIINFFNKLFRSNPTCMCGAAHY